VDYAVDLPTEVVDNRASDNDDNDDNGDDEDEEVTVVAPRRARAPVRYTVVDEDDDSDDVITLGQRTWGKGKTGASTTTVAKAKRRSQPKSNGKRSISEETTIPSPKTKPKAVRLHRGRKPVLSPSASLQSKSSSGRSKKARSTDDADAELAKHMGIEDSQDSEAPSSGVEVSESLSCNSICV
jgi:hypothetical protein